MKKLIVLSVLAITSTGMAVYGGIGNTGSTGSPGAECPSGCVTTKNVCCKTKGGSSYYGSLN